MCIRGEESRESRNLASIRRALGRRKKEIICGAREKRNKTDVEREKERSDRELNNELSSVTD